jgi:hypothetical protein
VRPPPEPLAQHRQARYGRASEPERRARVPKYRPTLVVPYHDYLHKRRANEPSVPVAQLLGEIRERGYQSSSNLLVCYLSQGRAEADQPHLSPRRAARVLHQARQPHGRAGRDTRRAHHRLPEMTALTSLITSFVALLAPAPGNDSKLRHRGAGR